MEKTTLTFTLCYGTDTRSIPIQALPTYSEVINYAKNLYPVLNDRQFTVGYTDDEEDFVFAKSDLELSEAYRLAKSSGLKEIKLFINTQNSNPDTPVSSPPKVPTNETPISNPSYPPINKPSTPINIAPNPVIEELANLFDDSITHINQLRADLAKAKESFVMISEKEKIITLERELLEAKDALVGATTEHDNLKETLYKMGTQLQAKLKEVSELRKDRDGKLLLKTKLENLEKQVNGKTEENLSMSKLIHNVTIERDHFSRKSKQLEDRQQTIEQELITSYQLSPVTPRVDPHNKSPLIGFIPVANPATPIHTEPPKVIHVPEPVSTFHHNIPQPVVEKPRLSNDLSQLPPDIDEDDITILQSMGFNLDEKPHLIFGLIRKHKDISKVIEELLNNK